MSRAGRRWPGDTSSPALEMEWPGPTVTQQASNCGVLTLLSCEVSGLNYFTCKVRIIHLPVGEVGGSCQSAEFRLSRGFGGIYPLLTSAFLLSWLLQHLRNGSYGKGNSGLMISAQNESPHQGGLSEGSTFVLLSTFVHYCSFIQQIFIGHYGRQNNVPQMMSTPHSLEPLNTLGYMGKGN